MFGRALSVWRQLTAVAAFNAAGIALFVWLAEQGWPGAPSRCLQDLICYCEQTQRGLARQPLNTWSNLAVVPVALLIAANSASLPRGLGRLGLAFSIAVSCQGLCSMFFHGSLTQWGAVLDGVSIFFVVGLVLGVNLVRLRRLEPRRLPAWVALCLGIALGYRLLLLPVMAPLFLLTGALIVVTEWAAARAEPKHRRRWFRWAMLLLLAATLAWSLSLLPGFPLCSQLFPWGHALWHVLAALLTGTLWLHARETWRGAGL